jgi:hypothetical protein
MAGTLSEAALSPLHRQGKPCPRRQNISEDPQHPLGNNSTVTLSCAPSGAAPLFEDLEHSALPQFGCGRVYDGPHSVRVAPLFTDYFSEVIFGRPQFNYGYLLPGNLFNYNLLGMFGKTARDVFNKLFDLDIFHKPGILPLAKSQGIQWIP